MLDTRSLLRGAYKAALKSPDPSTQNGAIVLVGGDIVVAECNRFPDGVILRPERLERPLKYQVIEHAERNAIFAAAKAGHRLDGATMVCPWFACCDCARAIIQSGISHVIGHQTCMDKTPDHWKDSIKVAFEMLTEAGVETEMVTGPLGGCEPIRFNGETWEP